MEKRRNPSILIICKWSPPDQAPIGYMVKAIADNLKEFGWDVKSINGIKFFKLNKFNVAIFNNKYCIRIFKILDQLIFSFYSFYKILCGEKFDIVYAISQPITQYLITIIGAKIRGSKVVFNIQDLHPDALFELGIVKNSYLKKILKKIEIFGYRYADSLFVISEGFAQHCIMHGAKENKIRIIPNWIDLNEIKPSPVQKDYATSIGYLSNGATVLYAGSLSLAAEPAVLIFAAQEIEARGLNVKFLIVGEGSQKDQVIRLASDLKLKNVVFLNFQPRKDLNNLQALSTVSVVTMRPSQGKNSVPSKIYGYMSAAKPVIAAVDKDSETARIVTNAQCGWVVPPRDFKAIADAIQYVTENRKLAESYGRNGRIFVELHNGQEDILEQYKNGFQHVIDT